jgi:hypothetical protein
MNLKNIRNLSKKQILGDFGPADDAIRYFSHC